MSSPRSSAIVSSEREPAVTAAEDNMVTPGSVDCTQPGDEFGPYWSSLSSETSLGDLRRLCHIPESVEFALPAPNESPESVRPGYCCVYEVYFKGCGLSFPIPELLLLYLEALEIALPQCTPNLIRNILCAITVAMETNFAIGLDELAELFSVRIARGSGTFTLHPRTDRALSDDENFTVLGKPPEKNENSPNLTPKKSPHKNETSRSKRNFTVFGKPPEKDENSPNLTPKKDETSGSKGNSAAVTTGLKGNSEALSLVMSSLRLAVGQRCRSKDAFELVVKLLAVRDGFDIRVPKSNKNVVVIKCWLENYLWKVRASTKEGDEPDFYVRIYDSEHTCSVTDRSQRSRHSTYKILGDLYRDYLGDVGPSVKPKSVGILINKILGIKIDYWKSYRTLRHARLLDQGTHERSFQELPSYLYMIRQKNPGTFAKLQIDDPFYQLNKHRNNNSQETTLSLFPFALPATR